MSDASGRGAAGGARHEATAPIEVVPERRPRAAGVLLPVRLVAGWLHCALASAVVVGVFLQVYLIGAYIFGAGQGALDAHRSVGFTVHGLEVLVLLTALVAWLPRLDLALSLLLAAIGTVQVGLANDQGWVGGLHPLLALVVLSIAAGIARRGVRRCRASADRPRAREQAM